MEELSRATTNSVERLVVRLVLGEDVKKKQQDAKELATSLRDFVKNSTMNVDLWDVVKVDVCLSSNAQEPSDSIIVAQKVVIELASDVISLDVLKVFLRELLRDITIHETNARERFTGKGYGPFPTAGKDEIEKIVAAGIEKKKSTVEVFSQCYGILEKHGVSIKQLSEQDFIKKEGFEFAVYCLLFQKFISNALSFVANMTNTSDYSALTLPLTQLVLTKFIETIAIIDTSDSIGDQEAGISKEIKSQILAGINNPGSNASISSLFITAIDVLFKKDIYLDLLLADKCIGEKEASYEPVAKAMRSLYEYASPEIRKLIEAKTAEMNASNGSEALSSGLMSPAALFPVTEEKGDAKGESGARDCASLVTALTVVVTCA